MTIDNHALTTSAEIITARAPCELNALHAHAAGIASGRISGTRNRAGPLVPAHHIVSVEPATKCGTATTAHSSAMRRVRANPAIAIASAGAVARRPYP